MSETESETDDLAHLVSLRAGAHGPVRLRTLVVIRWAAVAGQILVLLLVGQGLGFALPWEPLLAVIAASVMVNVFALLSRPPGATVGQRLGARISDREATVYLAYDTLQLTGLLFLTGGIANPFTLLIVAPVTIGASILTLSSTILLCLLAAACVTFLTGWHWPLPWRGELPELPLLYIMGLWSAIMLAILFIGGYAWRVAEEARRMARGLAATQAALARAQRVSALGALAAAVAHELGSPLSTIAVIAKELAREMPPNSPYAEDVKLLLSQSDRCASILAGLTQRPEAGGGQPYDEVPITALVEAAGAPYREGTIMLVIVAIDAPAEPIVRLSPEIMHGLGNLMQNAVQFARARVEVEIAWNDTDLTVTVTDDGPGIPASVLEQLGEPYISSRRGRGGHMGLGVFIAQTLLEQTGARLRFDNLSGGGARVVIGWPLAQIAVGELTTTRRRERLAQTASGRTT